MKKHIMVLITVLLVGMTFTLTACGKTVINSVTLSDATKSIEVNQSYTLTATVSASPDKAANKEVTWESSDTAVATVDSSGKVIAVAEGTATITATSKKDAEKKDSCVITVVPATVVVISSVTLSDATKTIEKDKTYTLTATVSASPDTAANKEVTWESSNTAVAMVDSSGKVTAKTAGTATITATSKKDSEKKDTCVVTVVPEETAKSLSTVKTHLEGAGWTVGDQTIAGISALVAIKGTDSLTVLFFGSKSLADASVSTYKTAAEAVSQTCKQNVSNIYYGTAAGIAAFEAA